MKSKTAQDDLISDDLFYTVTGHSITGTYIPASSGGSLSSGSVSGSAMSVTSGGMTINLILDAAAQAAPASFKSGLQQAVAIIAANITDKITVNINIDYSGTGGGAAAKPDSGLYESYSWVRSELVNNASAGDTTFAGLPTGSAIQRQSNVAVWNAQLKLWGVIGANDTTTDDGSATFATDIDSSLLVGVALHELTHALGRVPYGSAPDVFDLYRFTSPGVRLFSGGATAPAAYFSLDGGSTKLADYGQSSDPSDFLNSGVQGANDPFNEFYNGSTAQGLTAVDLEQLAALGFHIGSNQPVVTAPDFVATHNQNIAASSLFTVSDSNGYPITEYHFWDSTADPISGHFVVGGVAQAPNQNIDVLASQLASTTFQSGSGSDDLWVQAFDGTSWSAWKEFHVNAPVDQAPVVSAPDYTATHNQNIAASSLFTASDAEGDPITTYHFWDSTTDPSSGHFVVGGVAQGTNQNISVSASQLAGTTFQSGSGSDDLWVQAFDGMVWSAWKEFHVNAPVDQAPVVSAPDYTATHNQNIAASSLFSVSDAEGDPITTFRFWDSTSDPISGHFVIGGAAQGANHNIDVSASQLASTTFLSGSGSDDLWVQAFDGTRWSAWKEFHVNGPVDQLPVVSASDFTATHNQNIATSSLFSVSDAESDPITAYHFWDSTSDPSSGHFVIGGVAQGANQNITVTASQLASTTFQSASGSDDLWVQAFDGTGWGAWKEFHVNAPVDQAPVVSAPDYTATHNQNIAASSLFTVSDAEGDSITAYHFWDSTTDPSSGHFVVGGVAQGTNQNISVSASQLAGATFQSGTVSDDLWVQAFDGTVWGAWKEFHVLV